MSEQNLNQQQPTDALNVPPSSAESGPVAYGPIIGGVLVVLSFILTFSQEGKPLIMYSESTVTLGLFAAIGGGIAAFVGPRRWVATIVVVVLAALAVAAAAYDLTAYEQAVNELQRELQNF